MKRELQSAQRTGRTPGWRAFSPRECHRDARTFCPWQFGHFIDSRLSISSLCMSLRVANRHHGQPVPLAGE